MTPTLHRYVNPLIALLAIALPITITLLLAFLVAPYPVLPWLISFFGTLSFLFGLSLYHYWGKPDVA